MELRNSYTTFRLWYSLKLANTPPRLVWTSLISPGTALAMFFCNESATCCICCFCWESVFHFSIRNFPKLTLAELVAFWTCRRIVFRSGCDASCICWGTGACCAIASKPTHKIRTKITALAVFMGENSCQYSDVNRRPRGYSLCALSLSREAPGTSQLNLIRIHKSSDAVVHARNSIKCLSRQLIFDINSLFEEFRKLRLRIVT